MSASSFQGLTVWEPRNDPNNNPRNNNRRAVEVPQGTRRYRTVRTIVDRALFILESGPGRTALREVAIQIVRGRRSRGEPCLYPRNDPNFTQMDDYIDIFLDRMRSEPPEFYLTHTEGEAMTVRRDWIKRGKTINDFMPYKAGHMELNRQIIADMVDTRSNDDYNLYMFQMTISTAHEFGHFLTGFLTGLARPQTPPNVRVPGIPSEAGYRWEALALGGIVEFWSDARKPTDPNQPGVPYIFPDGRQGSKGSQVSTRYIEGLVSGAQGLNIAVQPSSRAVPISRRDLDAGPCERMTELRILAERAQQTPSQSGPGGASTAGRNRLQPQWVEDVYYRA